MEMKWHEVAREIAVRALPPQAANHSLRVGARVAHLGRLHETVGYLHDVAEDTDITVDAIMAIFGTEVGVRVEILTRRPGEEYERYVDRIIDSGDEVVMDVKVADTCDNLRRPGKAHVKARQLKALTRIAKEIALLAGVMEPEK